MAVLIAIVVLVGALCLLDLVLTFGVVRRLREHAETLERLLERRSSANVPAAGRSVGQLTAATVDGERLSFVGATAVVFVSPECESCRTDLPDLVAWAGDRDRERVLVVVDTTYSDGADFVAALEKVAQVVLDGADSGIRETFGVEGYPMSCVVVDGVVTEFVPRFSRLPALV
ncbi:hypothetical protein [Fodinicola acaciae]|uniref:hypothetical protein n=1 Tax=Fodinicola acaciae TaxID=2681555 RepID=UPI0013D89C40|nr:hypothetical protein [Fodinicola acaciae]